MDNFDTALEAYVAGVQGLVDAYQADNFPTLPPRVISVERGKVRARIVDYDGTSRSVYSFVDFATGDVLKAAGWKAPAKHARANIYSDRNGLENHGPYGPAYLR